MSILFPDFCQENVFEKCRQELFAENSAVFSKFSEIPRKSNEESKASFQLGNVFNNDKAEIGQKLSNTENYDKIFVDNDGNLIYIEDNPNDEKEFESIEIEFGNTFKVKYDDSKSNADTMTCEKFAEFNENSVKSNETKIVETIVVENAEKIDGDESKIIEAENLNDVTIKISPNVKNIDTSNNCIKNIEKVVESIQLATHKNNDTENTDISSQISNDAEILSSVDENADLLSSVGNYRDIFRALFLLLSKAHDTWQSDNFALQYTGWHH